MMRYGSVCSGIEAATVAWHPLVGWEAAFLSEIEPFPCAVLRHHYPDVPNLGDMTKYKEWPDESIDLLVGGTPCQSFSVAGLRKGLADPRGNLMLAFGAIAQRYRPRWLVWENVPGVLSSNRGRDFAAFLGTLEELGYGWAYRILDAVFFGTPMRRRRVYVVGCLDWRRAAAVLYGTLYCVDTGIKSYDRSSRDNILIDEETNTARLLTPEEIEIAFGFPVDYTLIPYRNKPAPDGPRYKALGNSMAVPVMRWIGERIQMVEGLLPKGGPK